MSSRPVGVQLQPSCPHFPSWYCVDRVLYSSEVRRSISNRQYLAALHQTAITFLWEGNLMAVVTLPALPPPPPPRWSQSVLVPFGCSLLPYLPVMPAVLEAPDRPSGGCGEGLTTTTRAAGASLAWLEPAISRLLDRASPGRPSAGTVGLGWGRLYACLPACLLLLVSPPKPPQIQALSSLPGPLLAAVQYCFCVSLIY